jgi:hypothetical protein
VKGIIKQILLATCVIGAPTCVFAYPFYLNPQSFQEYMSSISWEDGSRVKFQNLNSCTEYPQRAGYTDVFYNPPFPGAYTCTGGYATISNPMGTKTCELGYIEYRNQINPKSYTYRTGRCRYQ